MPIVVSRICVTTSDKKLQCKANKLANDLHIPLFIQATHQGLHDFEFALHYSDTRLELYKLNDPQLTGPVFTDFTHPALSRQHTRAGHNQLFKAAVIKGVKTPTILDATGGLGRDAFLLAGRGGLVRLIERSPIIAALTADGLKRAAPAPLTRDIISRITLTVGNSISYMQRMQKREQRVDVIYLDPMFPIKKKKSKSKKNLQMLQQILGPDRDEDLLIKEAIQTARHRVVVKRGKTSPLIADLKPSFQYKGQSTRYDVYLI